MLVFWCFENYVGIGVSRIKDTVIILVFMGEFTFYWYVYIVLAILFFVMSTCVLELTLQRQYQRSIIENLIRDE